jgi:hypothetical protein
MDAKRRRNERRCCCECGGKYQPEPSAKKHQRTCDKACRLKRRARQARERYRAAPLASREAARERKRRSRGDGSVPPSVSLPPEVTRAIAQEMEGLSSEGWLARGHLEQALRRVAQQACASTMSRAGLGADPLGVAG